jgi:hypothetical protein
MNNSTPNNSNPNNSTPNPDAPKTDEKNVAPQTKPAPQNIGGDQKDGTKDDVVKENKDIKAV